MEFKRNFSEIKKLNKETLFSKCIRSDCKQQDVFMAIRNGYLDFYHKGGRLFKFDKNGFQTHIKYAAVIEKDKNDYLTEVQLSKHKLSIDFIKSYSRIKENCANYSGIEAKGVSRLYHKYSYLSDSNIIVLDIEVSFESDNKNKKQDRIDILLYDKENKILRFVEAKHYSNKEIISKTKPDVINQIKKYEKQIKNKKHNIITAYSNYINIINEIFKNETSYLPLPLPNDVEDEVTLFIFGFDKDQKEGRLTEIEKQLLGIKYYSVGNVKNVKINSLWNQAKIL